MIIAKVEYWFLDFYWAMRGYRRPSVEDATLVASNVTFIFKSFERQKQAVALYKSILKYYPKVRVIIADDSSKPLVLSGENLRVIQMPFNSGLSKGLNMALAEVKTPFCCGWMMTSYLLGDLILQENSGSLFRILKLTLSGFLALMLSDPLL